MTYRKEYKSTRNTSPRSKYGGAKKPTGITIHHWGSDGQKHDNVVSWLRGVTGNRGSSAHEVISAGRVTILAPATVATWHSGNNVGNGTTAGFECRPEMSAGDWATLVERCADFEEEWGSMKYFTHDDWKNTECPGRYRDQIGKLVDDVNAEHARRKGGSAAPPKSKPSKPSKPKSGPKFPLDKGHYYYTESKNPEVHSGYWEEDRPAIRKIQKRVGTKVDGGYGGKTKAAVKREQKRLGIKVDGATGLQSWSAFF